MHDTRPLVCAHGQLTRSCDLCERDAEIARLTRELDEARKLYEVTHSALFGATQRIDELEARLAEARKENERLRLWVFGPLPAAPNEAGKP